MLNQYFDAIIAFTPYWRNIARQLGIKKQVPIYVFPHGFDHNIYYPIPRNIARIFYGIPDNAFAILNLNRNQPRKRWDHTMIAFADVTKRYYDLVNTYNKNKDSTNNKKAPVKPPRPLRLVVGTAIDASWSLLEVYEHELMLRGVPCEFAKECIIGIANPQQLSDSDINILYNSCDIGLNTCEGEGFGLCQIEHLAVGSPQVCSKIGGLQEFLNAKNSILVDAKMRYYIDKHRDGIGGIAEMGMPEDFADAIWKYYTDPKLVHTHAAAGRKYILQHYKWSTVVEHMYDILFDIRDIVK
jgi:glycosyltransferase involved in cell wall biosynthesis